MRKRRRYEDYGSLGEVNTTSLLDLAFILLIVFIVALPLLVARPEPAQTTEEDLTTTTSEPAPGLPADTPPAEIELHVLGMAADRTLRWDDSPMDPADLTGILAGFQTNSIPVGLKIELDPALGAQDTADLMEFIRPHAITNIVINTTP